MVFFGALEDLETIYNMRPSFIMPDGFVPIAFITGTFNTNRSKDDVEIAVRKYELNLARANRSHIVYHAGIEWGHNSHFHLAVGTIDISSFDLFAIKAASKRLWGWGKIEVDPWDADKAGHLYIEKHHLLAQGREVFCGGNSRSCRKNRCQHQIGMRF